MDSARILRIAQRQLSDYDARQPGTIFAEESFALSIWEAHAVQMQVAELRSHRGERLAGYKVGCTSKRIQEQLDLDQPVFGHLYATEMFASGASLRWEDFQGLAMEGEFALRLRHDINDLKSLKQKPWQAVLSVFPVIELHNYVFRSRRPTVQELVANNAMHAGVILSLREASLASCEELLEERITVFLNQEEVGSTTARETATDPWASLFWLAERLADWDKGLKKGQIILTGSLLPLFPVGPGDHVAVRSTRLGYVECSVGPSSHTASS